MLREYIRETYRGDTAPIVSTPLVHLHHRTDARAGLPFVNSMGAATPVLQEGLHVPIFVIVAAVYGIATVCC